MIPKGVTTQMKALDEYFLMVVFIWLLNRVHVFAIFVFNLDRSMSLKGLIMGPIGYKKSPSHKPHIKPKHRECWQHFRFIEN